jgi:hypothetical protein
MSNGGLLHQFHNYSNAADWGRAEGIEAIP